MKVPYVVSVIILLLTVGVVTHYVWFADVREVAVSEQAEETDLVSASEPDPFGYLEVIDAKVFYDDDLYTLVGEIPLPSRCDLLQSEVVVQEPSPETVQLNFTVLNNADSCVQVLTAARFQIETQASAEASFVATFEGRDIRLNLVEPEPGESPTDFELFSKG